MCDTIFKIIFERPTYMGTKEIKIIAKNEEIHKYIHLCRKNNYRIINIEHI